MVVMFPAPAHPDRTSPCEIHGAIVYDDACDEYRLVLNQSMSAWFDRVYPDGDFLIAFFGEVVPRDCPAAVALVASLDEDAPRALGAS